MIDLFIPGEVPSPNAILAMPLRQRMRVKRAMRERAFYVGLKARREGAEPARGPADVHFHAVRSRRLDPSINLPASLKWIQDGLSTCAHRPTHARGTCPDLLLPLGDGITSPYRFRFDQSTTGGVRGRAGVHVTITARAAEGGGGT